MPAPCENMQPFLPLFSGACFQWWLEPACSCGSDRGWPGAQPKPGVKIKVSLEIQAETPTGFDESTQRAALENCSQLKFKNHGWQD